MYVGSKGKKTHLGCVYVINATSREIIKTLRPDSSSSEDSSTSGLQMQHPAGIAVGYKKLYVIDQNDEKVYSFWLSDGSFAGVAVDHLPPRPEQLTLLYC